MRLVLVAVLASICGACSTPVALRRAQVLEKGEVEIIVAPLAAVAVSDTPFPLLGPVAPLANIEGSIRFGAFKDVDVQLRFDPMLSPEISAGYQLIGDPGKNEFALTVTGGTRFGLVPFGALVPIVNLNFPVQLLADIPVGDEAAIFLGLRTITGVLFVQNSSGNVFFTPGVVAGVSLPFGPILLQPEIAASMPIHLAGDLNTNGGIAGERAYVAVALAAGWQFDLADLKKPKTEDQAPATN